MIFSHSNISTATTLSNVVADRSNGSDGHAPYNHTVQKGDNQDHASDKNKLNTCQQQQQQHQQQQQQQQQKYHALVLDSGAIIKQTSLYNNSSSSLLHSASAYYTVPAVLAEIRDAKSRQHLEELQDRLHALHNTTLQTRLPSRESLRIVSDFARKTGDYSHLSNVDLQVLSLLYDLELEASRIYNDGRMDHIRKEPKRVLGVYVTALNGGHTSSKSSNNISSSSNNEQQQRNDVDDNVACERSGDLNSILINADSNGMIDVKHVDIEYDDEEDDDCSLDTSHDVHHTTSSALEHEQHGCTNTTISSNLGRDPTKSSSSQQITKSWAQLVNPQKAVAWTDTAITVPSTISSFSAVVTGSKENNSFFQRGNDEILATIQSSPMNDSGIATEKASIANTIAEGQFDDASSADDPNTADIGSSSDEESNAIHIANARSDDEFSDEECDVFVLDPHEAVYFKKLKENIKSTAQCDQQCLYGLVVAAEHLAISQNNTTKGGGDNEGLDSEFPSLAAAAAVPYEGSDDEYNNETSEKNDAPRMDSDVLTWQEEEEERKKKALMPMINGRFVQDKKKEMYNSFRRHGHWFSADGSAETIKKHLQEVREAEACGNIVISRSGKDTAVNNSTSGNNDQQQYKSRILGVANIMDGSSNDANFSSEMTAEDDDGEGWVTCTREIHVMKAKGSLSIMHSSRDDAAQRSIRKEPNNKVDPPSFHRAACATTDFAMQNVILQMNLELLSIDGVRVRRLKTWVTRCGACFSIYGDDSNGQKAGARVGRRRLFCDKCGCNTLHRIAASIDRNTGRLKLHMKKNYQYNTRGTKFSLPKPGKGNKYKGDLLLAEDQLLYGAWNQKLRMGKSKASSQSIFGSDLASDLGCVSDMMKRDDIKVGFGRRNPNSTKFGRERRGKKKKNTDEKACGLRRY